MELDLELKVVCVLAWVRRPKLPRTQRTQANEILHLPEIIYSFNYYNWCINSYKIEYQIQQNKYKIKDLINRKRMDGDTSPTDVHNLDLIRENKEQSSIE